MATKYAETYRVGGRLYGLEKTEDGYALWAGGCGVGRAADLESARSLLHTYIVSHTRAERAGWHDRYVAANKTLARLEGDVFNLAKFAVFEKEFHGV